MLWLILEQQSKVLSISFANDWIWYFVTEGSNMDLLKKSHHIHKISNHPVHVLEENGDLSPSSFIPFCQLGDKVLGIKIPQFPIPVCNIFRPKILNDQLCYEVDLNQFKESFSASSLKKGLTLFIDNNEDRQYTWIEKYNDRRKILGNTYWNCFIHSNILKNLQIWNWDKKQM